jgi:hypothetical protein
VSSSADRELDAERREAPVRLPFDHASRDVAGTRRVAIGATIVGAALLAGLAHTWWAYGIALASFVAVRFWARRVAEADAHEGRLAGRAIELGDEGLSIPRADGETTCVRWEELQRVEIDHERLILVLRRHDGSEVEIEPTFGSLGLDGLAHRIEAGRPGRRARPLE